MEKFKSEITHEFDGKTYNQIPIKGRKADGFTSPLKLFIEKNGNEIVAVNLNDDVVARIIGESMTIIPID
jgi:hypothetical protein